MLSADEKEKAAVIERLRPDFIVAQAEFLEGGLSNRCMKLTSEDGRQFVWRPEAASVKAFGLSRDNEFEALRVAAKAGLAAQPVKRYPEGLLTPWIEGDTMTEASLSVAASLQAKIHELPPLSNVFDPFDKGLVYFDSLSEASKTDSLNAVHGHFQNHRFTSGFPLTTCHYDLGYYNLISQKGGKIKVIDWEYAALGDPTMDLVMTSLANGLVLETLVNRYCQIRRIDSVADWQDACRTWQPVAGYLGALWYALGYELFGEEIYQARSTFFLMQLEPLIEK
ncbi:phosphotransferase [Grimontia sp. NTOU-MAR1]|uniref:phosphotransferase n=1 Tax=Grimontia sp. NTOU-MAR1 TaxID=3111011 RepID=UPI002DB82F29|nr:phosphotransferase [Grimontia sp. NTOU-MAR1]WRV98506.1 phosphotransferase [Grimontia sp. NTOU-MAR1]